MKIPSPARYKTLIHTDPWVLSYVCEERQVSLSRSWTSELSSETEHIKKLIQKPYSNTFRFMSILFVTTVEIVEKLHSHRQ